MTSVSIITLYLLEIHVKVGFLQSLEAFQSNLELSLSKDMLQRY